MPQLQIHRNARVTASDGEVGRVRHLIVDPRTHDVTHMIVGQGGREWPVPISSVVIADGEHVWLRGTRAQFQPRGHFNRDNFRPVPRPDVESITTPHLPAREPVPAHGTMESAAPSPETAATPPPAAKHEPHLPAPRPAPVEVHAAPPRPEPRPASVVIGKQVITERRGISIPTMHEVVVLEHRTIDNRPAAEATFDTPTELRVPLRAETVEVETQVVVRDQIALDDQYFDRTIRMPSLAHLAAPPPEPIPITDYRPAIPIAEPPADRRAVTYRVASPAGRAPAVGRAQPTVLRPVSHHAPTNVWQRLGHNAHAAWDAIWSHRAA